jgi:hypothetical protein
MDRTSTTAARKGETIVLTGIDMVSTKPVIPVKSTQTAPETVSFLSVGEP